MAAARLLDFKSYNDSAKSIITVAAGHGVTTVIIATYRVGLMQ
jgi:hypothetical protein